MIGMWTKVMLSVAVALTFASEAVAQCRVEGVVRSLTGAPVAGAMVVLDPPIRKTSTDAEGRYGFDDVKAGSRVKVTALQGGREMAWAFSLVSRWVEQIDLQERPLPPVLSAVSFNDVRGIVRTIDGRPLAAVSITVDEPKLSVMTDAAGRYVLTGMPSGVPLVVHAGTTGFKTATQEVVVPAARVFDVDFSLTEASATPSESGSAGKSNLDTFGESDGRTLRPEQVKGLPSLVEKDVFRAVQLLPGVAGTQEASTDLMVRGSTSDQTLITYDGITLYNVDHLFGFYSAVNMEGIQAADFTKSNVTAGDGGRLSGTLRLTGQSKAAAGPTGFVDMSMLGLGGLVSVPLGDRASLLLAARRSNPSSLYDNVLDLMDIGGKQAARGRPVAWSGGILRAPSESQFHDFNGKFELKASSTDRLSVSVYDAMSVLDRSRDLPVDSSTITALANEGMALPSTAVSQSADVQDWTSRGVGGSWAHQWSSSTTTTLTVGRSEYSDHRDRASMVTDPSTGEDFSMAVRRGGNNASTDATQIRDTTVRLDSSIALGFAHALSLGGEMTALDIGYAATREAITGRRPDGGYDEQLGPLLDRSGTGRLTTVFAQDGWRPSARFMLSPGVRVTHYDVTGSSYVEPRLSFSYQATSLARVKGGWGIDHQFANRVTHEDLVQGDSAFWTLADGTTVPVERSRQIFGGGSLETSTFLMDVQVYYKALDDLAIFAPRLMAGAPLDDGANAMHLGSGTSRGMEVLLQQKSSSNNAWISYTLSKAEYAFPTLEANVFPGSQDQTHEVKVADIARIGARWTVGATWVYSSGRPTTPVSGVGQAWWPSGLVVYQPAFGAKNSERLPAYHRLDLSTQREFRMAGVKSTLGVSVLNVYNRSNVWFRDYQGLGSTSIVNDVTLMGRTVNFFAKIGF